MSVCAAGLEEYFYKYLQRFGSKVFLHVRESLHKGIREHMFNTTLSPPAAMDLSLQAEGERKR